MTKTINGCMLLLNLFSLPYFCKLQQTGSGKTYTMIGYDTVGGVQSGVVPRLCTGLLAAAAASLINSQQTFSHIPSEGSEGDKGDQSTQSRFRALSIDLSLSYYEIYNERVYDLLSATPDESCRVRESKEEGAYVENLTRREFLSYENVATILDEGNTKRSTAATLMNATSSRSHAVFTIYVSQQLVPATAVASPRPATETTPTKSGTVSPAPPILSQIPTNKIIQRNSKVFEFRILDIYLSIFLYFMCNIFIIPYVPCITFKYCLCFGHVILYNHIQYVHNVY